MKGSSSEGAYPSGKTISLATLGCDLEGLETETTAFDGVSPLLAAVLLVAVLSAATLPAIFKSPTAFAGFLPWGRFPDVDTGIRASHKMNFSAYLKWLPD
jgi:hypothetical protein